MKKIFTLLFATTVLFSCSNNSEVSEANEAVAVDFESQLSEGVFDDSNLGSYKGVFTTLDGQNRATIAIELDGKNNPSVSFGFPDGTKAALTSAQKTQKGQEISSMKFSGEDFEFDFSVEENGTNPIITNITYMGSKGEGIVAKETSKSAVVAKTGTYTCLNCNHPELGKPGARQTFNSLAVTQGGMGNGAEFTLQVTLNSRTYPGTMTQSNCGTPNRGLVQCELSGTIQGNSGPGTVTGTHLYDNETPTVDGNCSDLRGNWVYNSTLFGQSTLAWETDAPVGSNCF